MNNTIIDSNGQNLKILKLQLGFLCSNCNSMVPVRNLIASKTICPTCRTKHNLNGKHSLRNLLNIGNPNIHAIEVGLSNRKETSAFYWIKLNITPYKLKCPKCNTKILMESIRTSDTYSCTKCSTVYSVLNKEKLDQFNIYPLLDTVLTEIIPEKIIINKQTTLNCMNCGAPLEIKNSNMDTNTIECVYCNTLNFYGTEIKDGKKFNRPEILFFVNIEPKFVIEQIKKVPVKKSIVMNHKIFLKKLGYSEEELNLFKEANISL